jgi:HAD superfamily hydrolase (TIGR01484 family)
VVVKNSAIIFDIDGTVVNSPSQKLPSERMIKAFHSASRMNFLCAATGRPWTFAVGIVETLSKDPCIVAGGAQIRSADGQVLWQCSLETHSLIEVQRVISSYDNLRLLFNEYAEADYLEGKGVTVDQIPLTSEIYFLEVIYVTEKTAYEIKQKIDMVNGVTCTVVVAQRPGLKDLHITNEFATKEHAITELLKIIQVDVDKTIGVGDGHNDLHLFAAVKTKIAMGNAVSELKAASDLVIGKVTNDGFAEYLESM